MIWRRTWGVAMFSFVSKPTWPSSDTPHPNTTASTGGWTTQGGSTRYNDPTLPLSDMLDLVLLADRPISFGGSIFYKFAG